MAAALKPKSEVQQRRLPLIFASHSVTSSTLMWMHKQMFLLLYSDIYHSLGIILRINQVIISWHYWLFQMYLAPWPSSSCIILERRQTVNTYTTKQLISKSLRYTNSTTSGVNCCQGHFSFFMYKEIQVLKILKAWIMVCPPPRVVFHIRLKTLNCLNPSWWFLNTILGTPERVTYGKSIRKLILKTKTWQVHLLINSSVGARITSATGVLTTINPHFRQGEPYWHIFLIWIFNYSVVPH